MNKVKLQNIYVYAFESRDELLNTIQDKQKILIAVNAEKILNKNKELHDIINNNIGYPDGVGAVLALRQRGLSAIKIPGAEFWLDIIKRFENDKTFYLIGSSSEVIEATVEKLNRDFLNINILGYRNGYLDEDSMVELKKDLLVKKPDVVFVAQGSPRQEYLMNELMEIYPALYMGLGGSYDVYCGLKKRAPDIFINFGLEWFYRLLKEPTRIGRQMILLKFIVLFLVKKI